MAIVNPLAKITFSFLFWFFKPKKDRSCNSSLAQWIRTERGFKIYFHWFSFLDLLLANKTGNETHCRIHIEEVIQELKIPAAPVT